MLQSHAVFFCELIRRAASIFAGDGLEVVDADDRGNTRADGADKKTADLGPTFGNRAEAAHHFRRQTIDNVETQMNYHGMPRSFPDVVTGGILCPRLHFSYRFIVLR